MKKILIVDDNQVILNALCNYLRYKFKDYTILAASGGEDAIQTLGAGPIDLVLTDLDMPIVDGYQVISYAERNCPATRVILMTGSWSLDLEVLIARTGVVHCIEKPFRFEELEMTIQKALSTGGQDSMSPQEQDSVRMEDVSAC